MPETPFLDEAGLKVDRTRVMYGNNTYAIASIASVTTSIDESGGSDGCLLLICFIVFFILSAAIIGSVLFNILKLTENVYAYLVGISSAVIAAFVTMKIRKKPHYNYRIHMTMADGRETVLTYPNARDRQRAIDAINKAIAVRG